MGTEKPMRGRPNNKVRRTVAALHDLNRADELVDKALELRNQAHRQFADLLASLNKNEFARYVQATDGIYEED
jgi:hypothetical protein